MTKADLATKAAELDAMLMGAERILFGLEDNPEDTAIALQAQIQTARQLTGEIAKGVGTA
jgi:hypothetical protein